VWHCCYRNIVERGRGEKSWLSTCLPLPIMITNTRVYKSKAGPLAFLYDLSAPTVYDVLLFDVDETVHRDKFLIIKPTRCTNFSNLFLEWNSTCFGQFLCPSSGVFYCTHSNGICHTSLLTACEQDQDGTISQAVNRTVRHMPLLCVQ
jgi:hypothetical protein